jgi:hypothetical protein
MDLKTTILPLLLAGSAHAGDVFFSAPPEMRAFITEEILKQHSVPVDVSAIDDALFNSPNNVKERVTRGELDFEPPASLPAGVQQDLRDGLEGCRARLAKKQNEADAPQCAGELVQTVWQRHIQRTRPERILEFKPAETEGGSVSFMCATYRPKDSTLSVLGPRGKTLEPLVRKAVVAMLTKKLEPNGVRPTSDLLPGGLPPPNADLSDGIVQTLAALELPAGCRLPALTIGPEGAPLAKTIAALWLATAGPKPAAGNPVACALSLDGEPGARPSGLTFACRSSLLQMELFPGTHFADPEFQADVARALVRDQIAAFCPRKAIRR